MEEQRLPAGRPAGDVAFVAAVADQVLLGLPAERLGPLAEAAAPVHAALRRLASVDLGEIAPATSFDASWDASWDA